MTIDDLNSKVFIIKRTIMAFVLLQLAQDDVGYGFVVRGDGPVYVKTVDPESPSARSGLKVRIRLKANSCDFDVKR